MAWIEKVGDSWRIRERAVGKKVTVKGKLDSREIAEQVKARWEERQKSLPKGPFDVILADPPWKYNFSKSYSRAIESHYQTMELEEICALKVPAAKNAILYLWATAPKLVEALNVMADWGFDYKTNFVWVKTKIGMGYYGRGRHELLLIGTKGKFSPPKASERYQSVINASQEEHSKKPDIVYDIIESAYPPTEHKLLELFARNKREGWTSWGNELNYEN